MTEFFDLSHPIENGMTVYPGDLEPVVSPAQEVEPPWRVSQLIIGTHTGTHIDAASHYTEQGMAIDQYPVERFIQDGIVVSIKDLEPDQAIESAQLEKYLIVIPKGGVIVLRTGWDRYWGHEQYMHHPFVSPEAVELLAMKGIAILGIDALNVDSTVRGTHHAHDILLGKNILIVENLRGLDQLQAGVIYRFSFLPLPLRGLDGSPVRAVAWKNP